MLDTEYASQVWYCPISEGVTIWAWHSTICFTCSRRPIQYSPPAVLYSISQSVWSTSRKSFTFLITCASRNGRIMCLSLTGQPTIKTDQIVFLGMVLRPQPLLAVMPDGPPVSSHLHRSSTTTLIPTPALIRSRFEDGTGHCTGDFHHTLSEWESRLPSTLVSSSNMPTRTPACSNHMTKTTGSGVMDSLFEPINLCDSLLTEHFFSTLASLSDKDILSRCDDQ